MTTAAPLPCLTDEQILLNEIEAFLRPREVEKPRMAESTFGFKAANDGKLISRLRAGKTLTFQTARQVRAYMASAAPAAEPEALAS